MAKVSKGIHSDGKDYYLIFCKGCGHGHAYDSRWSFNGDFDKPTFYPSYLFRYKHPKGYSNDNPAPIGWDGEYAEEICHSYVENGMIRYMNDSTHELSGQEIELFDLDKEDWE